jgi:hypothetical protein
VWAAATGHPEAAVLLAVAEERQFVQAGFKFQPKMREYIERARLSLSSDLVEHLASAGRELTHEQAMQRVRALLSASSDHV